jgi:hypothetical protein
VTGNLKAYRGVGSLSTPVLACKGQERIAIIGYEAAGFEKLEGVLRAKPDFCDLAEASGLPRGLGLGLDERISRTREEILSRPGGYVEARPAVSNIQVVRSGEKTRVTVEGYPSDYAATVLSKLLAQEVPVRDRVLLEENLIMGTRFPGFLTHSLGVQVLVITRDSRVVLSRRSASTEWCPQAWQAGVWEGVSGEDAREGVLDLYASARRALQDEGGLFVEDLTDGQLVPIVAGCLLSGTVSPWVTFVGRTELSVSELVDRASVAEEAWEVDLFGECGVDMGEITEAVEEKNLLPS